MNRPKRATAGALAVILVSLMSTQASVATPGDGLIQWQGWSDDLFERAKRENRFVILDLEAVWCHWCHVMEEETYRTPQVAGLINARYIPVRVDQDANPDLSNRYGNWGWPATIVFAPDGTEIVKRRGFIPPVMMISLLQAIIDDPSPGPSVLPADRIEAATAGALSPAQRDKLENDFWAVYDREHGGWGNAHKFVDLPSLEYAMTRAQAGSRLHELMARQTLNQALLLIDREWGGIYQYSDTADWRSPHYEKIMLMQFAALRAFALAHQLWGSERVNYLAASQAIHAYLREHLMSPRGGYHTSQDADVDLETPGEVFYGMSDAERTRLGRRPRVDTHRYARENGWVITGLASLYDASGDASVLQEAIAAAGWVLRERGRDDGGFDHGERDRRGPFLGDNVAMVTALTALYASTGERRWYERAASALDFVESRLRHAEAGYLSHPVDDHAIGVFKEGLRVVEENVALARAANQLYWYAGAARFKAMSEHAMRYLAADALTDNRLFLHGVLLADREMTHEPVHITIVGGKQDPAARKLHAAARAYPGVFKRLEWWDRSEGPLPNPDVTYPQLSTAAAFACTDRTCSLPVFEPDQVAAMVDRLLSVPR